MIPVDLIAVVAISALGSGPDAWRVGPPGSAAITAIVEDVELVEAGLRNPFAARAAARPVQPEALLATSARQLAAALDESRPGWRTLRIGVAVGTSSGGMRSLEHCFAQRALGLTIDRDLARRAPYFGPLSVLEGALGVEPLVCTQVLAACASATMAIGIACRWLALGSVDLALAGGYDALALLVAAGFESLRATSATRPAPFRIARDGMALGEGAALLGLTRHSPGTAALAHVVGFGASSDAVHVTAPDRTGAGLESAARRALEDASLDAVQIDLVSAHATGTPYNDAAEARAIRGVLGAHAEVAVVHPHKAVIGHTLGAAGALELLAAVGCLRDGTLPAAAGTGALDPDARVRLLDRALRGAPRTCLKLSAAFGGANAALVASLDAGSGVARVARPVAIAAVGKPCTEPDVDAIVRHSARERSKLLRSDVLSQLAQSAVARVIDQLGEALPADVGVVCGSVAATIEIDEAFAAGLRERGARRVDPRRFPATSPNLAPGECSIAFRLLGPSFGVGAGLAAPLEALAVAHDLIAAGDAEALLVVAADDVGAVVGDLWRAAGWPAPHHGAAGVLLRAATGPGIDRASLGRLWAEARANDGRLRDAGPGWPALLGAVAALAPP